MRRLVWIAAVGVVALFVALLFPSSPVRFWLLAFVGAAPSAARVGEGTVGDASAGPSLRVAIGAMISPERTYSSYGELFSEVAKKRGRRLELVQRGTYREVNVLLEHGEVDMAWICTGAWPELHKAGTARLLAVPVVGGRATYNALVIAGPSTTAGGLRELRGARFAFTDPMSLTGCLYPRSRLTTLGLNPAAFFGTSFFTHGHDLSIEAVRTGFADAASVDSLVFDYLRMAKTSCAPP